MPEVKYDPKTGAPVRDFPLVMTNGDLPPRSVHDEGAYVQAVYDGYKEPETKTEARQAERQLPKS